MMNPVVPTQPALPLVANHLDQVCNEAVNQSSTVSESSATGAQAASKKSAFAKAVKNIALPIMVLGGAGLTIGAGLVVAMPMIGIPLIAVGFVVYAAGLFYPKKTRQGMEVGGPNDRLVEKPESPETVIKQSIDQAFDSLPNRIQLEMSKLPRITPELARRYNTTVAQLQTDQVQAIKTVSLHTVLDQLKSATDEHWDRHSRQAQKSEINSYAQSAILDKLARLQTEQGLNALVAQAAKSNVEPQSTYGLSQREFFALNRIADGLIRNCLSQKKARSIFLDLVPVNERTFFLSVVPVARRAQIKGDHAMAMAMESLYMAFDKFVRPNDAEPDMTQVRRLHGDTSNDSVAKQWLQDQQSSFNKQINDAFKPFGKSAGYFAKVVLEGYLQQAGKLKTAFTQDKAAFAGARQKLEQVRQEVSKNDAIGTRHLKGLLQIGLQGIREMIEDPHCEFADLRQAQDDNRSGTPWKDSRLHQHVENMADPNMLAQVRPHQRAAVLDALAAYGEKTVKLLNEDGLTIRTGTKDIRTGTEEKPVFLRAFFSRKKNIYNSPYQSQFNGKLAVPLRSISYFSTDKKILLDETHTEVLRNVAVHELGHALDSAIAKQIEYPVLFTDRYINLKTEYDNAKKDKTMITRYAQMDQREMFAESASAYMGVGCGYDSTFAKPVGSIKSRENLQARHPVTAQFLDEVLRAPSKAVRAANTPLTVDDIKQ